MVLCLAVPSSSAAEEGLEGALQSVRGQAFRAHVEFLADDLLEGREPGTVGYDLAALYVATQLQSMGVDPGGDDGSFFQSVALRQSRLLSGEVTLVPTAGGEAVTLEPGDDYIQRGDIVRTESRVTAPAVFAGFGVVAEELDHDDYAGLDVEGAIVVLLSGAPPRFPSEHRAHFSSRSLKALVAAQRGAVGVAYVQTAEDAERVPWERLKQFAGNRSTTWLHPDGTPEGSVPQLRGRVLLGPRGARRLFQGSPISLDEVLERASRSESKGFALPTTVTIASRSDHRSFSSDNVVGVVPGSDPDLARTSVVYTAHLDHVGVREPVDGDRIYNGAYDNASGSAIILEIARAFSRLEARPRRSVVFLFVTAEESGLLGSDYFAKHPTAAAGRPVANLNIDMTLFLHPISKVVAFGSESSTLGARVDEAASAVGLTVIPDPTPEENSFIRSDQYSFVLQGVPAVCLYPLLPPSEADTPGGQLIEEFRKRHYHRPSDDLTRPMDLESAERYIRANILIGHAVASDLEPPRWNPGDFFGVTFGRAGTRSDAQASAGR